MMWKRDYNFDPVHDDPNYSHEVAELLALRAGNARRRKALEEIAALQIDRDDRLRDVLSKIRTIARRALAVVERT
jgi:hypothetical protein